MKRPSVDVCLQDPDTDKGGVSNTAEPQTKQTRLTKRSFNIRKARKSTHRPISSSWSMIEDPFAVPLSPSYEKQLDPTPLMNPDPCKQSAGLAEEHLEGAPSSSIKSSESDRPTPANMSPAMKATKVPAEAPLISSVRSEDAKAHTRTKVAREAPRESDHGEKLELTITLCWVLVLICLYHACKI